MVTIALLLQSVVNGSLQILTSEVLKCDMPCQKEVICSKKISTYVFLCFRRKTSCEIFPSVKASMTTSK